MIDDSLQFQIHNGSQEAFLEMSRLCAKDVYLTALGASGNEELSRTAAKNALLRFRRALISSEGPVDSDVMLSEILEEELGMPLYPLPAIPDTASSSVSSSNSDDPVADEGNMSPDHSRASSKKTMYSSIRPKSFKEIHPTKTRGSQTIADSYSLFSTSDRWILISAVFFLCCMIWAFIGILMDLSILPPANLGFRWFNRHIFPLFRTF